MSGAKKVGIRREGEDMDTAMVCCSVFDGQIDGSCIRSFIHSFIIYIFIRGSNQSINDS